MTITANANAKQLRNVRIRRFGRRVHAVVSANRPITRAANRTSNGMIPRANANAKNAVAVRERSGTPITANVRPALQRNAIRSISGMQTRVNVRRVWQRCVARARTFGIRIHAVVNVRQKTVVIRGRFGVRVHAVVSANRPITRAVHRTSNGMIPRANANAKKSRV